MQYSVSMPRPCLSVAVGIFLVLLEVAAGASENLTSEQIRTSLQPQGPSSTIAHWKSRELVQPNLHPSLGKRLCSSSRACSNAAMSPLEMGAGCYGIDKSCLSSEELLVQAAWGVPLMTSLKGPALPWSQGKSWLCSGSVGHWACHMCVEQGVYLSWQLMCL